MNVLADFEKNVQRILSVPVFLSITSWPGEIKWSGIPSRLESMNLFFYEKSYDIGNIMSCVGGSDVSMKRLALFFYVGRWDGQIGACHLDKIIV